MSELPTVEGLPHDGAHVPLIERFRGRLPFEPGDPLVSLQEGSTPLLRAPVLSDMLGANVRLKPRRGGHGSLVIDYASLDELQGLVRKLRR